MPVTFKRIPLRNAQHSRSASWAINYFTITGFISPAPNSSPPLSDSLLCAVSKHNGYKFVGILQRSHSPADGRAHASRAVSGNALLGETPPRRVSWLVIFAIPPTCPSRRILPRRCQRVSRSSDKHETGACTGRRRSPIQGGRRRSLAQG